MELAEDSIDEMPTAKDAAAAAIALFAFVLNHKGALQRYHHWLVEQGVLEDPDAAGGPREYRAHLELVMAHFMGTYELFELNTSAGRSDPGLIDARMTPEVAPVPSRALRTGKAGGRHRLQAV